LAISEGAVAIGAVAGAVGLARSSINFGTAINTRLPFESPVFAGGALSVVVGVPMAVAAVQSWRGGRWTNPLAMGAGALLMGWIVVEIGVIRSFSWLQPTFLLVGGAIAFAGYREWHLTWGATSEEAASRMPGDEIHVPSTFTATRAITIDAPAQAVWPWLAQVGKGRAGFYSYDLLDSGGRPSANEVLTEFQDVTPGALAAPMSNRPSALTSFVVVSAEGESSLVWAKSDSVWAWQLTPGHGGTRLVVRLRAGPDWNHPLRSLGSGALLEIGDFPMMHKMLRGIQERAESNAPMTQHQERAS
jgi:hypothetical protein